MAARYHLIKGILALLLHALPLICESSQTSPKFITKSAGCLKECNAFSATRPKTKVSRSILSCHEQCLLGRKECPPASSSPAGEWIPSEVEVAFGQYVNTTDWYVNATWTSMNDSLGNWNNILIRLSIEVPEILVAPVHCYVLPKNQTFFTVNISSYYYQYPNPIYLQVIGLPFTNAMSPIQMFFPEFPTDEGKPSSTPVSAHTALGKPPSVPFTAHTASSKPPNSPTTAYTASSTSTSSPITADTASGSNGTVAHYAAISLGILVGLVLTAIPLMYLRRCKRGPILLPSDYKYHAFIIFKHEDILWTKELLTFLEEKHNLKCCIHYRDFEPGVAYPKNMAKSVYESYKVIAVFSKNFLKSNDCIYELDLAIYRRVKKRDNSLVVIRIDDVDSKYLPAKLKKINFIDYSSIWERPFWKHRLLTFLGFSQDSGTQDTVVEHNGGGYRPITGRPAYGRLDSTTSADSALSTTSYV